MLIIYDNSFEAFLSAVFDIYEQKLNPSFFEQDALSLSSSVLAYEKKLDFKEEKFLRVKKCLIKKIGLDEFRRINEAWLSGQSGKDKIIYEYIRLVLIDPSTPERHNFPLVRDFHDLASRVGYEKHRMLGFARFIETAHGFYYAAISPDNDVLELIMPHFVNRFGVQKFVIHDYKRGKAVFYDGRHYALTSLQGGVSIELSQNESLVQEMFRQYFNDIAIKERTNKRLQNAFMPRRYRVNMHETFAADNTAPMQLDFLHSAAAKCLN